MKIIDTLINDVKLLQPKVFGDERGFFMETFRDDWFRQHVADVNFVQDNHSLSNQGILRGLHFQTKQPQGKLIRVVQGAVFDVVVDLRRSSPFFGQWCGHELSSVNKLQMWVPAGFAHGFYVLEDNTEFVYKCTDYYAPEYEKSLLWNDSELNIDWPIKGHETPILSDKDKNASSFKELKF